MSEQHSHPERPNELPLSSIPIIAADSDEDEESSPNKHIEALVRRHESAKQAERAASFGKGDRNNDSSFVAGVSTDCNANAQSESPEDTRLSGQDASLYAEPSMDDNADARSTDTEGSGPPAENDSLANDDETDFGRLRALNLNVAPLQVAPAVEQPANDAPVSTAAEPAAEPVLTEEEKRDRKIRNIVQEVLDTERAYVSKLELIHQGFYEEFRERNKREQAAGNRPLVSEETLQKVFRNEREIWRFHADTLLPALSACVAGPNGTPAARVGAVLKKFAPFFKMYTEYTTNYDADMRLLNAEMKRNERFAQLLAEIQRRPQCGMLTLQQHMLEPIQRIPRYELLLSTYLKYLPGDDSDRADAEAALKLVREAVLKGEMRMKGSEEFKRMLELSEIFSKEVADFIQPTRSLIKEGKVYKVSARNENERSERYLFLFSDMLLICTQIPFSSAEAYKMHGAPLKTEGMEVRLVSEADVPGFTAVPNVPATQRIALKTTQRQIEFAVDEDDDRADWLAAFQSAARSRNTPLISVDGVAAGKLQTGAGGQPFIPGREAPKWVRDSEATMCMVCGAPFNVMTRRHHCRSCGRLVCSNCSQYRIPLLYTGDHSKPQRVCRSCFELDRALRTRSMMPAGARGTMGRPTRGGLNSGGPAGSGSHASLSPAPGAHNLSVNSQPDEQSYASDADLSSQQSAVHRTPSNTSSSSLQSATGRRTSGDQPSGSPAPGAGNTGSTYSTPSTSSVYGAPSAVSTPGVASAGNPARDAAGDPALLKAYALISSDHGRSWERRFIALREDFAIYIYKAHADICARETIPLPGYKVNKMKEKERVNALKLGHPSGHVKSYLIQLNDPSLFVMWVEALEHLVCARLPPNATSRA